MNIQPKAKMKIGRNIQANTLARANDLINILRQTTDTPVSTTFIRRRLNLNHSEFSNALRAIQCSYPDVRLVAIDQVGTKVKSRSLTKESIKQLDKKYGKVEQLTFDTTPLFDRNASAFNERIAHVIDLLEDAENGLTINQIAEELCWNRRLVCNVLRSNGFPYDIIVSPKIKSQQLIHKLGPMRTTARLKESEIVSTRLRASDAMKLMNTAR